MLHGKILLVLFLAKFAIHSVLVDRFHNQLRILREIAPMGHPMMKLRGSIIDVMKLGNFVTGEDFLIFPNSGFLNSPFIVPFGSAMSFKIPKKPPTIENLTQMQENPFDLNSKPDPHSGTVESLETLERPLETLIETIAEGNRKATKDAEDEFKLKAMISSSQQLAASRIQKETKKGPATRARESGMHEVSSVFQVPKFTSRPAMDHTYKLTTRAKAYKANFDHFKF